MADCEYQIEGSDKIYSESEFKKLLSEGYLDKVMMDKGIKIKGIKADEALASSFQLPSAIQPQVQPTAEVTETVTPEVKTEEVVTPTETVTKTEEVVTEPTTEISIEELNKKKEFLNKEFNSLNKQYVKDNKQLDAATKANEDTSAIEERLDNTQEKMSQISSELETVENDIKSKEQTTETKQPTKEVVTEPTTEVKTEQVNERKRILSEELDNADINSLRTSLRKKDPNGYTLQILDELQEAKKNENLVLDENVAYMLDNGITLSNVKNMLIEDGLFETSQEVDNYFMQIGGQKSSGLFKRLSGLKTEPTTKTKQTVEEATLEAKQKRIEAATKNFADSLRKAKMTKGNAMSSIIPPPLWNAAIDIVADSVQVGGIALGKFSDFLDSSIKKIKDSDFFKNLSANEKRNFSRNIRKELAKYASDQFNLTFNQADIRDAEFNDLKNDLEAAKTTKPTARQLETLKNKAKKFVERNLPNDVYNKSEVLKEINNNFDKVKTVNGIEKALERENKRIENKEFKIETAEAKQAEKDRKAAVKRIKEKTNPRGKDMTVKANNTRKARVSINAQRAIKDMRNKGMLDDSYLDSLNKEETDALEAKIDNILGIGKAERKQQLKEKKEVKKTSEATILQSLDTEDGILNSEEEINDMFEDNQGAVVVIDGRVLGKSDFKAYLDENGADDLFDIPFYKSRTNEVKRMKEKYSSGVKGLRNMGKGIRLGAMGLIRNIETYVEDLSKGSKEMREWITKVAEDTSNASLAKLESAYRKKKKFYEETNKIFGKKEVLGYGSPIQAASGELSSMSGVFIDESGRNPIELTNGEVVDLYNLVRDKYDGKDINADKVAKRRERVTRANQVNPEKVIKYIESNPKLKKFADLLADTYNKDFRKEYKDTFQDVTGMEFDDDYYYPEPSADFNALDAMNLENSDKGLSALAPNLKERKGSSGAFEVLDAREKMERYIDSMSHAKEFIPIVEYVRPLFSDINRPRVLEKLKSVDKYNDLKQTLEEILSDKPIIENQGAFSHVATAASVGLLMARPAAVAQQFSAAVNYYPAGISEGVGALDIVTSITPRTEEEIKFFKQFYTDNPYLWTRLLGNNTNVDTQALQSSIDKIANDYIKGTINAATFVGMFPIKLGDALAIATPMGGEGFAMAHFKKRLAENGGNYEDARKYAIQQWFKQTERTQQPSQDPTAISRASKQVLTRTIMPFISAQVAATRKAVIAVKRMKDWKNLNDSEKAQARRDFIYYATVGNIPFILGSGALYTTVRSIQKFIESESEEDKDIALNELKLIWFNVGLDRIQSDVQPFYFLGKIGSDVLNDLRGRKWFKNNPTFERLMDISTAVSSYIKAEDDWDDLTPEQQTDFYKRYGLDKFELKKFEKLNYQERQKYLEEHPFVRQAIRYDKVEEFKRLYSELSRYERMGKEGSDAVDKIFNLKNPKKLYKSIDGYLNDDATLREVFMNMSTEEEDTDYSEYMENYVRNKDDFFQRKVFGKSAAEMLIKPKPVNVTNPGGPVGGQEGGPVGGPK